MNDALPVGSLLQRRRVIISAVKPTVGGTAAGGVFTFRTMVPVDPLMCSTCEHSEPDVS